MSTHKRPYIKRNFRFIRLLAKVFNVESQQALAEEPNTHDDLVIFVEAQETIVAGRLKE